ncbi:class I SAM-dependent methyltransferase [Oscillatoria amoena NRMC-F 0135]|nr:class I SAM-dependent methyltransferase [Oscillatoria amoena NRMC-F 0135]
MVEVFICPLCESAVTQTYLTCIDHALSKEPFTLKRCESCSLGITSPRPNQADLPRYYQFQDYISHSGKTRSGLITALYNFARSVALKWKHNLIKREFSTGRILDVGCGTGEFLNVMKRNGWQVDGIEPSAVARGRAKDLLHQSIYPSIDNLPSAMYNVITLWHVLEHVEDPNSTLQQLKKHLNPEGILVLAVPNHNAYDAKRYAADWAGYDVPRHLWHFTSTSVKTLLSKNNLTLTRTLPMKLDAYYVSLLSEQYANPDKPISNFLRALSTGFLSNLRGKHKLNYSSLIFVAKATEKQ